VWKLRPLLELFVKEGEALPEDEYMVIGNAITNLPGWKSMSMADQRRYRDELLRIARARARAKREKQVKFDARVERLTGEFTTGYPTDVSGDMRNLNRWGANMDNRSWLTCLMLLFTSDGWRRLSPDRKARNFATLEQIAEAREEVERWRLENAEIIMASDGDEENGE
jgi:hypothetical protein